MPTPSTPDVPLDTAHTAPPAIGGLPECAGQASPLLHYVHARFREVLGEPYTTLVLDSQWSIRSQPQAPAIFVLVNGSYEKPAVWIFDPYTTDNVWRTSITTTGEVDGALAEIGRRSTAAAASWRQR